MGTSSPSAAAVPAVVDAGCDPSTEEELTEEEKTQYPSASQSEAHSRTEGRDTIAALLPRTAHDGTPGAGKCEWSSHACADLSVEDTGAVAWLLIETIMRARFGPSTALYGTWRQHTLAGTTIPGPKNKAIRGFIEPVFGLPDAKKSNDHLHGHVGEWLWHVLTRDSPAVRVQPEPKGDVTDAGSDGYSIFEVAVGLRFRLWESKKNTGTKTLSTSLNTAYVQIHEHGQRYVAKVVGAFSQVSNDTTDPMMQFIATLPEAWAENDESVGAGVALATHKPLAGKPFKDMTKKLPALDKPGQLRGLAISVNTFKSLAEMVRRYAWTAL